MMFKSFSRLLITMFVIILVVVSCAQGESEPTTEPPSISDSAPPTEASSTAEPAATVEPTATIEPEQAAVDIGASTPANAVTSFILMANSANDAAKASRYLSKSIVQQLEGIGLETKDMAVSFLELSLLSTDREVAEVEIIEELFHDGGAYVEVFVFYTGGVPEDSSFYLIEEGGTWKIAEEPESAEEVVFEPTADVQTILEAYIAAGNDTAELIAVAGFPNPNFSLLIDYRMGWILNLNIPIAGKTNGHSPVESNLQGIISGAITPLFIEGECIFTELLSTKCTQMRVSNLLDESDHPIQVDISQNSIINNPYHLSERFTYYLPDELLVFAHDNDLWTAKLDLTTGLISDETKLTTLGIFDTVNAVYKHHHNLLGGGLVILDANGDKFFAVNSTVGFVTVNLQDGSVLELPDRINQSPSSVGNPRFSTLSPSGRYLIHIEHERLGGGDYKATLMTFDLLTGSVTEQALFNPDSEELSFENKVWVSESKLLMDVWGDGVQDFYAYDVNLDTLDTTTYAKPSNADIWGQWISVSPLGRFIVVHQDNGGISRDDNVTLILDLENFRNPQTIQLNVSGGFGIADARLEHPPVGAFGNLIWTEEGIYMNCLDTDSLETRGVYMGIPSLSQQTKIFDIPCNSIYQVLGTSDVIFIANGELYKVGAGGSDLAKIELEPDIPLPNDPYIVPIPKMSQ